MSETHQRKESRQAASVLYRRATKEWTFHLYSIWLFTFSDLKTILIPSTAFGLLNSIAVFLNDQHTFSSHFQTSTVYQILRKTPLISLWVWLNLLPFNISNQRQLGSIQEDQLNKPWRPLPSQRLSHRSAKRLMLVLYSIAITASVFLGNLSQCIVLICFGYIYNDLGYSDVSWLIRNLINACGFTCFSSGAMQVAVGGYGTALQLLGWWFLVIGCIIFSTVQIQDMYDQRGDAARNRKTAPLVMGDVPARWMIAAPMVLWSWITPWLWASSTAGYVTPVSLGLTIAVRTLMVRNEEGDKRTFQLWNLWLISVYLLPLIKAVET